MRERMDTDHAITAIRADRSRAASDWLLFLGVGLAGVLVLPLAAETTRPVIFQVGAAAAVAAMIIGIVRSRPENAAAWWMLAAGITLSAAGDFLFGVYPLAFGQTTPVTSIADVLWLPGGLLMLSGIWALLSGARRRAGSSGALDSGVVAGSLLASLWIVLFHPLVSASALRPLDLLVGVYPLLDVLMIAVLCGVLFLPRSGNRAYPLLVLGVGALAVADTWAAISILHGGKDPTWPMQAGWLFMYVALGALALHPSMGRVGAAPDERGVGVPRGRFGLLAAFAVTPALAYGASMLFGVRVDPTALLLQVLVVVLILVRLSALLRESEARRTALDERDHERRRLLERILQAGEEERRRLAAELHDGAIQHLAGIGFELELGRIRLEGGDLGGTGALLERASGQLSEEIEELRRLMAGLRPPVLSERGLVAALHDHVQLLARTSGPTWEIRADLPDRLDPRTETLLYRVAQESLTNVVRHADARTAWVWIGRSKGGAELCVGDDGVGFDAGGSRLDGRDPDHVGLAAMRERVNLAGGAFRIRSAPGEGTLVTVTLPVPEVAVVRLDEGEVA
jgi:signal transduction histidine kinase